MIFAIFVETAISYVGSIRKKNRESLSFSWFSLKNDNLGMKLKILKFLGILPKKRSRKIAELWIAKKSQFRN